LRGVFEDMAEVAATLGATNLGAHHPVAAVFEEFNGVTFLRFIKGWPAAV
jgi:hypothetical protein